jgi:hypothetical protein
MNNKNDMKNKKAVQDAINAFKHGLSARNSIAYRLRAECEYDADLVRALLARWLLSWTQRFSSVDASGQIGWPDVDIEIRLKKDAPPLESLRWLLNETSDLHVAAQSLDYANSYTGERVDYELVEAAVPNSGVLKQAAEDAKRVPASGRGRSRLPPVRGLRR